MKYFATQLFYLVTNMINYLKKIFNQTGKYSLSIINIEIKNNDLLCRICDRTNVNPYNIFASEILKNDSLLSQIKPREIIKLKELYDEIKRKYVFVIESRRENKYKILYHDHEFIMSGKDICKDMKLLNAMNMHDAFNIIYNTGYFHAIQDTETMSKLEEGRSKIKNANNIIQLRTKD